MLARTALVFLAMAASVEAMAKASISPHDFLTRVTPKLLNYVEHQGDATKKSMEFKGPAELHKIFEDIGVPLAMGSEAVDPDLLLGACDAVMEYGLKTGSPLFNNQLFGAADPVAIAGDWLGGARIEHAFISGQRAFLALNQASVRPST